MTDTTSTHNLVAKASLQDELSAALEHIRSGLNQLKSAGDTAGKGLQDAGKEATGLQGKLTELAASAKATGTELVGGLLGPLGLAAVGAASLGAALTEAIKGAEAEQASVAQLTTALKNNVPGWQSQTAAINARIEAGKQLGFDDEATRQSMALLVTGSKNVTTAINLEALAMDLARGKGMDLQSATVLLNRVQAGHLELLGRYGITIEKGATATQALAEIQQRYGGQASAYAQTLGGAMDRVKIAIDDAAKSAGEKLAPYIIAAAQALADFLPKVVDAADKLFTILKPALDAVGLVFGTVGFLADQAGQALGVWSDNSSSAASTADKNVGGSLQNMSDNFSTFTTNAQTSGTDAGSGFTDNLSGGISDGQPSIDTAVGDVGTSLDISNNAGDTGDRVGTRYVQGTPGGIVPAINAGLPSVAKANLAIGETLDKPSAFATIGSNNGQAYGNAMRSAVAAFGGPIQQTFGGAPQQTFGIPASAPVASAALFTPAPPAPTLETAGPPPPNKMPMGHRDTAFPSAEDIAAQKKEIDNLQAKGILTKEAADFDKALLDQEAALTQQRGQNIDTNRKAEEDLKKMNEAKDKASKAASDHAAQLAKEAAAAAARASAAEKELDQQGNMRKATDDLTAAQKLLSETQAHWKAVLDDDAKALAAVEAAQKSAIKAVQDQIDATKAQEQALADGFDQASHDIDVSLRAPTAALREMQRAAQEAQDAFDAQAHALSDSMYELQNEEKAAMAPLNDAVTAAQANLTKEQDALEKITEQYQGRLLPLRHELAALDEAQSQSDHAEQLHKEQVNIDNLAASLATATGAQRQQLQSQLDAARAQQGRDSRKFQLQDQIAALEEAQKKEEETQQVRVKAAQAEVKAAQDAQQAQQKLFDARKKQIEDEQALLDHQRAEFDYEEKRKEEAKQKEIDGLNDQKQALQQNYDDAKRILDQKQKDQEADLQKTQAYWQSQVDSINAKAAADKKMADGATAAAQQVVDAAQSQQKALSDAYTVMDQINSAHDKGAKLTADQANALAAAKKTIDEIVPKLGDLSSGYSKVSSNMDTSNTAITQDISDLWDPKKQKSIPALFKEAFNKLDTQVNDALTYDRLQVWGPNLVNIRDVVKQVAGQIGPEVALNAKPLGDNIIAGIVQGVNEGTGSLTQAIKDAISKALADAQKADEQSSPSKRWAREMGKPMAAGVAMGFRDEMALHGATFGAATAPRGGTAYAPVGGYSTTTGFGAGGGGVVQWTGNFVVQAQKLPQSQSEWDSVVIPMSRALQKRLVQLGRA